MFNLFAIRKWLCRESALNGCLAFRANQSQPARRGEELTQIPPRSRILCVLHGLALFMYVVASSCSSSSGQRIWDGTTKQKQGAEEEVDAWNILLTQLSVYNFCSVNKIHFGGVFQWNLTFHTEKMMKTNKREEGEGKGSTGKEKKFKCCGVICPIIPLEGINENSPQDGQLKGNIEMGN